jgi:hypothetical protein
MAKKVNHILQKWKNYANNSLFDDNINHQQSFVRNKTKEIKEKAREKTKEKPL